MKGYSRKAAVAAYKERKVEAGIYAIRCTSSDQVWVGSAPDLATIQNRIWFTLRQGSDPHRSLQEAWITHGSDAFSFEIVEKMDDQDDPIYIRHSALKKQHAEWVVKLSGIRI
nr:GIY-YIG nuclease family protein [uncultured Neokomagataea sp.]